MDGSHAASKNRPRTVLERCIQVVAPHQPAHVLDIGCGEGRDSSALARATGALVIAVDIDPVALGRAPRVPGVHYVLADTRRLPIASTMADAVYSYGLLQVLREGGNETIRVALREMRRTLKRDGNVILGTVADFRHQGPDFRSLTGAEVSQVMRGTLILRELIGVMDTDAKGHQSRYWYIHALPVP
mgnify:CR=1 FL=1